MYLSVVVPAHNEAQLIADAVDTIVLFMQRHDLSFELLVVDDGSTDATGSIVQRKMSETDTIRLLTNPSNMGKGYSIRRGMLEAKGDYVLFTDADLSVPIEEFEKLVSWMAEEYDVVIGSRYLPESQIENPQSRPRRILGWIYYELVHAFLLPDIADINCGLKCYTRDAAQIVFPRQRVAGWGFDAEALVIAQKNGLSTKEVPVTWRDCSARDSRVKTIAACFETLKELIQIKMNDWRGLYSAPQGSLVDDRCETMSVHVRSKPSV